VRRTRRASLLYAGALVLLVVGAFPLFWMLSTSLKPSAEIFATPPRLVPAHPTLENFGRLFGETSFVTFFRNSALVSLATVALTLSVSALGAYGLTRFTFAGREKVAGLILTTYMFAPVMIIIPFYILVKELGIVNTRLALVLSYTTFCLPFCLWLLRAFFESIPLELEEAALVDGATRVQAMVRVVLPLAAPGLLAAGLFCFTLSWNEFLYALIFIADDSLKTLPVGLSEFVVSDFAFWGQLMAAAALASLPVIVVYIYLHKYMVQGLTAGAVKG